MGAGSSSNESEEQWRATLEKYEDAIFDHIMLPKQQITKKYVQFEYPGAPDGQLL